MELTVNQLIEVPGRSDADDCGHQFAGYARSAGPADADRSAVARMSLRAERCAYALNYLERVRSIDARRGRRVRLTAPETSSNRLHAITERR